MPENTAELMRQVYIYFDHKKACQSYHFYNQKDTIFASFLSLSYFSNVYPLHEMVFL